MAARAVDVGAIVIGIEANTRGFIRGITNAQTRLVGFGKSAQATGRKISTFGRSLSFAFTLPFLAGVAASVKAFGSFDAAMTKSLAIMGDVSDGMREEMARTAEEMSKQTTFAAKELAEAYFFLASAGFDAQQSMAALSTVAKFAQAGNFDLSQATELLGDSLAALGLQVEDFQQNMVNMTRLSDVLVKANVLAQASTQQFAEALTRAAGIMKAYGVDVEEGVAVLAAFAKTGRKAESGGEAFSRLLRLLVPAAAANTKEFKRLNIEVFNVEGNLRNMADVIGDMERAFEGMSAKTKSAELEALGFQRRMQGMILPVLGFSEAIRGWEKDLRNAAGTTEEVAAKQLRAFNAQIKIMWNRIVVASKRIGKVMIPALTRGAKSFAKITDAVERLDDRTIKWALAIGGAVAVLGPLLTIVGGLMIALGSLSILVGSLGGAFLAGLSGIFSTVAVLGALTLIVASLVPAIMNLIRTGSMFGNQFADDVGGTLDEANTKTMSLGDRFQEIGTMMRVIGPIISLEWSKMIGTIGLVADAIRDNVLVSFKNFWSFLKSFFPWFIDNWGDVMSFMMDASVVVTKNIAKNWKKLGLALVQFIANPLRGFDFDVLGMVTEGLDKVRPESLPELKFETGVFRDIKKELKAFQDEMDKARENLLDPSEEINALNTAMDAVAVAAAKRKQDLKDLQDSLDGVLDTMKKTGDTQFADAIEAGSAAAARAAFAMARMAQEEVKPPKRMDFPEEVDVAVKLGLIETEFAPGPPVDISAWTPVEIPAEVNGESVWDQFVAAWAEIGKEVPPVTVGVEEDVFDQFVAAWAEIGEDIPPVTVGVEVEEDVWDQFLAAWAELDVPFIDQLPPQTMTVKPEMEVVDVQPNLAQLEATLSQFFSRRDLARLTVTMDLRELAELFEIEVPSVEIPVTVGDVPPAEVPVTVGEVPDVEVPPVPPVEVPVDLEDPFGTALWRTLRESVPEIEVPVNLEDPFGTAPWRTLRESAPEIEVGVEPVWTTFNLNSSDFEVDPVEVPVTFSIPPPVDVPVPEPVTITVDVPDPGPVMVTVDVPVVPPVDVPEPDPVTVPVDVPDPGPVMVTVDVPVLPPIVVPEPDPVTISVDVPVVPPVVVPQPDPVMVTVDVPEPVDVLVNVPVIPPIVVPEPEPVMVTVDVPVVPPVIVPEPEPVMVTVDIPEPETVTVPVDVPELDPLSISVDVPAPEPVSVPVDVPEAEVMATVDVFIPPLPDQTMRAVVEADTSALDASVLQAQQDTTPAQLPAVQTAEGPAAALGTFAPGVDHTAEVASGLRQLLEEDRNQTARIRAMVEAQGRTNQLLEAVDQPEVVTIS